MLIYIAAVLLYCYALSRLTDAALAARTTARLRNLERRLQRGLKRQGKAHV